LGILEVMIGNGFKLECAWVMQGSIFQTSRRVRQGDPLSPMLFDLVTAVMIDFAKSARHIIDLVPRSIHEGLNSLHHSIVMIM
jgi:hypothetical protein